MAFTGTNVADQARVLANDSIAPNRFDDAFCVREINDGMQWVAMRHPESLYTELTVSASTSPTLITALADAIPIRDEYRQSVVNFVVARMFEQDGDHAANLKKASHMRELLYL
mgnify:CR=1 FL=1